MSRVYFSLVLLALTGCVGENTTSKSKAADRVYTVDEFVSQPELRQQFFDACKNNPGELGETPNCINVFSAQRIASAGTRIPDIFASEK